MPESDVELTFDASELAELIEQFEAVPTGLRLRVADRLAEVAAEHSPVGATGVLAGSWHVGPAGRRVFSTAPHAHLVARGSGPRQAHGKALFFSVGGVDVFTKSAAPMPANPFHERAKAQVIAEFEQLAAEATP